MGGFAFIEFDESDVAEIVADTMNGYFILEKRVICQVVPKERIEGKKLFKNQKRLTKARQMAIHRDENNVERSPANLLSLSSRVVRKEQKKRKRLHELGIDFDFPGYEASLKDFRLKVEKVRAQKESGGMKEDKNGNLKDKSSETPLGEAKKKGKIVLLKLHIRPSKLHKLRGKRVRNLYPTIQKRERKNQS